MNSKSMFMLTYYTYTHCQVLRKEWAVGLLGSHRDHLLYFMFKIKLIMKVAIG